MNIVRVLGWGLSITEALRQDLEAVYLGYWIKNCKKMNYKTQYRPIELLINQRWVTLN
jgi:arginine-tRNA-protein transferase